MTWFRVALPLVVVYCCSYGLVFITGVVGNVFVIAAVGLHPYMRSVTNYYIANLAVADLLICVIVVPATLQNNILLEWHLGEFLCKFHVWLSGTSVCCSVYTLVAVSADRYLAICHPLRYNVWGHSMHVMAIALVSIWVFSCALFSPWFVYFKQVDFPTGTNETLKICMPQWPSADFEPYFFLIVNVVIAFVIPLTATIALYALIFLAIHGRTSKPMAIDRNVLERENRIRLRVMYMMLIVLVLFVGSWAPLYAYFTVFQFVKMDLAPPWLNAILRPLLQWSSLANSCINPILYAYYSTRFRRAFLEIIVMPCRARYANLTHMAERSMRRISRTLSMRSGRSSRAGSKDHSTTDTSHSRLGERKSTNLGDDLNPLPGAKMSTKSSSSVDSKKAVGFSCNTKKSGSTASAGKKQSLGKMQRKPTGHPGKGRLRSMDANVPVSTYKEYQYGERRGKGSSLKKTLSDNVRNSLHRMTSRKLLNQEDRDVSDNENTAKALDRILPEVIVNSASEDISPRSSYVSSNRTSVGAESICSTLHQETDSYREFRVTFKSGGCVTIIEQTSLV